jgi:hypothetical protein
LRTPDFERPPVLTRADGRPRTVGVEIEFAGLTAGAAAQAIGDALGGVPEQQDPHAYTVVTQALGEISVELDSRYLHPSKMEDGILTTVMPKLASLFGAATSYVIPCEVVTAPIPFDRLPAVDRLVDVLRRAGGRGTQDGPFYAFGLHFNPEAPRLDADTITAFLKSFVLLNTWLRREVAPDATRGLLGFADPFPDAYIRHLVRPDYRPDQHALIADYLLANPTRNRDCDLLPLLTYLDEDQVRAMLPNEKIGKRPTFHYRLPDARVSDPGWSIAPDWNRWVAVERMAADPERLDRLGEAYLSFAGEPKSWADLSARIAFA